MVNILRSVLDVLVKYTDMFNVMMSLFLSEETPQEDEDDDEIQVTGTAVLLPLCKMKIDFWSLSCKILLFWLWLITPE